MIYNLTAIEINSLAWINQALNPRVPRVSAMLSSSLETEQNSLQMYSIVNSIDLVSVGGPNSSLEVSCILHQLPEVTAVSSHTDLPSSSQLQCICHWKGTRAAVCIREHTFITGREHMQLAVFVTGREHVQLCAFIKYSLCVVFTRKIREREKRSNGNLRCQCFKKGQVLNARCLEQHFI